MGVGDGVRNCKEKHFWFSLLNQKNLYMVRGPAVPDTVVKWHIQELLYNKDLSALFPQCLGSNSSVFYIYLFPPAAQETCLYPSPWNVPVPYVLAGFFNWGRKHSTTSQMSWGLPGPREETSGNRSFFSTTEYEAEGMMLPFWKQQFQYLLGRNSRNNEGEIQL